MLDLSTSPHDDSLDMSIKVVLVEDDEKISQLLSSYLTMQQIETVCVHDGADAVATILAEQPDLVILDLMLPNLDGFSICRQLQPVFDGKILFLTASEDDMDQVAALEMGADDFIIKPIQPRVLLARIRMLMRRAKVSAPQEQHHLSFGELELNQQRKQCLLAGEEISLTTSEFDLLWLLAAHADEILTREYLVKQIRGIEYDGIDRTIDNKIVVLRKKLGDNPALPRRIITVRARGYLFVPDRW
ncbi:MULTISPECIES: response regulator [Shewanella]|uniref:response regulator n=1 Tax=Shewanella TaxID=22 RepID=UPI001182F3CA|nr:MULTISPECIES: response regulator [Shewanella]